MVVSDSSSNANFNDVTINHIHLDWTVDFNKKCIYGIATYDCKILKSTQKIVFDGRALDIESVVCDGVSCKYTVESAGIFGQKITLYFGTMMADSKQTFSIKYATTEGTTALQFVGAQMTSDKQAPFLYSQCEMINARSILPCMDTPSVKQTYSAKVTVPKDLICLMSALSNGEAENDGSNTMFVFRQPVVIPSYLIAIVVGILEKREISERCAIWAEPSQVDKAHWEFEQTEEMLHVAEELVGEYCWTRYDMVLLPPFFPFGGMENPMLTFLTPTIIAGDRSLTNTIAHEIAHSWTGNLVTNANWQNFWLNEGFTRFLEKKIIGCIFGEQQRHFESLCGYEDSLWRTVHEVFSPAHEFTKLVPNLNGYDPDDSFSAVPYEKGSALLFYIEQQLGSMEKFNGFLKSYIARFATKSITTEDFIAFLYEYFGDQKEVLDAIDLNKWIFEPGMPPVKPNFDVSLKVKCEELAKKMLCDDMAEVERLAVEEFTQLRASEKLKVLDVIRNGSPITPKRASLLDRKFSLSASGNCEILYRWFVIALKSGYVDVVELALRFVGNQGRGKYILPIYKVLFEWPVTRERAIALLKERTPFMHPISVRAVESLLKAKI